jgi:hypothetical protein
LPYCMGAQPSPHIQCDIKESWHTPADSEKNRGAPGIGRCLRKSPGRFPEDS